MQASKDGRILSSHFLGGHRLVKAASGDRTEEYEGISVPLRAARQEEGCHVSSEPLPAMQLIVRSLFVKKWHRLVRKTVLRTGAGVEKDFPCR